MSAEDRPLAVDIVITNHNYGQFLTVAIESALGQTHPEVHVIVVDDGSTDGSRQLLRGFDGRVEVVLKERGGQASAFNAGIERCRGEVMLPLDADDVLRPRAAERVAAAFAADARLSKVQFPMAIVDREGRPTGEVKPSGHLRAPTGDQRRAELTFPFDIAWQPGGGTAFRTEAIRRILPIPVRDYPIAGADLYLLHLAALLGDAAMLEEVCADYRVHGGNAYQPSRTELNLPHLRDAIVFAAATMRELEALADDLGLDYRRPILSYSQLANRMVSLRLDPGRHPVPGDSRAGVFAAAVRATARRFDVSWPMKALLVCWIGVAALAPRRLTRPLAEIYFFPARRSRVNRLLGRLRHESRGRGVAKFG